MNQNINEPLKIDILILKKTKDVVLKKNIARIFRTFNIVEYKSPREHFSIADYHKTHCYSRLYAVQHNADLDDMSVSFISASKPKRLLSYLSRRFTVKQEQPGIYLIEGDTSPTQIIVSTELPAEENLWLNGLRSGLTTGEMKRILTESRQQY